MPTRWVSRSSGRNGDKGDFSHDRCRKETVASTAPIGGSAGQRQSQANGIEFNIALLDCFPVCLPKKMFSKAISNILANAVAYTVPGGKISVYIDNRNLMIENECLPIPTEHLKKIFEPFYRPDYARNKRDGGNGLGLYIVACILNYLDLPYSFCPMKEPNGMRFTISLQSF